MHWRNLLEVIADCHRLYNLYIYVLDQQKQGTKGELFLGTDRTSYWKRGFYSAAVKSYIQFLAECQYEQKLDSVSSGMTNGRTLSETLQREAFDGEETLVACGVFEEGKETVSEVKTRVNQHHFRKMILRNYNYQCCITRIPVRDVLRASHIIPWAQDKANRLNPSNGLCLSATYDAAFDRHLIALDERHRLLLSPRLEEHTGEVYERHFKLFEGKEIQLPVRFIPAPEFLAEHRDVAMSRRWCFCRLRLACPYRKVYPGLILGENDRNLNQDDGNRPEKIHNLVCAYRKVHPGAVWTPAGKSAYLCYALTPAI